MTQSIQKIVPTQLPFQGIDSGQASQRIESTEDIFKKTKNKYAAVVGSVGGGLTLISLIGALTRGTAFPSRFLQVLGDSCGSVAALAAPYFQVKNEIENFEAAKNGKGENTLFDGSLKLFYRLCSQGLVPFIFERLLNPANITKSVFHKIAAVINIPFVAFTGYTWGFGNTQAIAALGLRKEAEKKEELCKHNSQYAQAEEHRLQKESYERIYNSAERMLTIGSIANPVMPCLQYAADGLHAFSNFIKGEQKLSDFFTRPILSLSRLISTVIAVPEAFAKGVDAFMRVVVNERHHLKAVLPEKLNNTFYKWGKNLEEKLAKDGALRKLKNGSEMVFHALSPYAMTGLFAPLLDRPHINEEAQSLGGASAFLDKWVGRYAKTLTLIFTGFYVGFGRLPQGIFQSIYFGRKLIGKYIKKENDDVTQEALKSIRKNIHDNPLISGVSKFAKKAIEKLVPNFYTVENEYGFPDYKQVLASNSFDQAQADYKVLFDALKVFSIKDNGENHSDLRKKKMTQLLTEPGFEKEIEFYKKEIDLDLPEIADQIIKRDNDVKELISKKIVKYCLEYSTYECAQGNYDTTPEDLVEIERLVREKISFVTKDKNKELVAPSFPGALFLARIFLRPLDFQSRLPLWNHDKLVKLPIYQGDEINSAFRNELEVVGSENADCLRRLINLFSGIPAWSN